ncbi:hypothetical protein ALC56_12467 [Trachymyrmex septentrionalis]|uniref:Uncharacterized protein n=1 Tax=Trachymyrmex septentrionalis TaxID=34720 RepID=A0A195EZ28_9HYME|nr:hypothetical protein ALC56_12467 [Trachymyrmex septentrionalis]
MRRDKASQDPQHEAGVPIKRAIRPVLRQPSQAPTNPCPSDSVSPLDPQRSSGLPITFHHPLPAA